jgi:ADP-ribose pyrophosphatase YjhB (NUDIX family)
MEKLNTAPFQPGVSIDCVIFGFHAGLLKVLLLKLKKAERWALPGGFIRKEESVDESAVRVLQERTGLSEIFLQQFAFFGEAKRGQQGHAEWMVGQGIIPAGLQAWFEQRFITLCYYALVEYAHVPDPQPDQISELCDWYALEDLPPLMLDHAHIIEQAHLTLQRHLRTKPIGLNLMPQQFTMPELRALYEAILQKPLDRRNFQRKMLSLGILTRKGKRQDGRPNKSPWLYEFDEAKYAEAVREGIGLGV